MIRRDLDGCKFHYSNHLFYFASNRKLNSISTKTVDLATLPKLLCFARQRQKISLTKKHKQ